MPAARQRAVVAESGVGGYAANDEQGVDVVVLAGGDCPGDQNVDYCFLEAATFAVWTGSAWRWGKLDVAGYGGLQAGEGECVAVSIAHPARQGPGEVDGLRVSVQDGLLDGGAAWVDELEDAVTPCIIAD